MAGSIARYRYVTDQAQNLMIRMDVSNAALVGATAADGTEANAPKGFRPRYVNVMLPSGRIRRITCPNPANGVWTGATTTISLPDFNNLMAPVTSYVMGRVGERRYAR